MQKRNKIFNGYPVLRILDSVLILNWVSVPNPTYELLEMKIRAEKRVYIGLTFIRGTDMKLQMNAYVSLHLLDGQLFTNTFAVTLSVFCLQLVPLSPRQPKTPINKASTNKLTTYVHIIVTTVLVVSVLRNASLSYN